MAKWQRWKGIMKCYPLEEKRLAKWEPPYIVQPKYDGFRCRAIPVQTQIKGSYILLSSEENIFYSIPHLNAVFDRLNLTAELDGELYNHQMYLEGGFDLISSVVSRTVNLHHRYQEMQFHLFDVVNDQPQMRRTVIADALKDITPLIQVAPFWLCESLDDVMRAYDKVIELGYEGIIVRHFQAPYQRKRSTLMMKFKPKKEDTYEIIGYEEEISIEGTPKATLGSLQCKSGDGNTFSVGTGFSEDLRHRLWQDRENLSGKIAKVKYQHLTSGRKVPRFPVFVEVIE